MEDIAPGLVEAITEEFRRLYDGSPKIKSLLEKVKAGTATYAEAQEYSLEVSRLIGTAYEKHISSAALPDGRMYYNIASRLIPSTMDENYRLVSDYAVEVQKKLNQQAKIGLKAQTAEKDQDRIDGLVDLATSAEQYDDVSDRLLSSFENYSQSIVDETIRRNADLHYKTGLSPKIVRRSTGKCCDWCRALVGIHPYPVEREIYQRHANCRCTVDYNPGNGKIQNVYTKEWYDPALIEQRKTTEGVDTSQYVRVMSNTTSSHQNVMPEYLRSATPGVGEIALDEGYNQQQHAAEINMAQWLHQTFGGDIRLLSESSVAGEKRADYLWNGRLWDLKTTSTAKSADSAIRKGLKQIIDNPGGIVLDYGENNIVLGEVIEVIDGRMKRGVYESVDIIIVSKGRVVRIIRYKK